MSASQEKRRRLQGRQDENEKLVAEQAAAKKKLALKRARNIVIAVVVVLVIAAIFVINSNLFYTKMPALTIDGTEYTAAEANYIYKALYYKYVSDQASYAEQFGLSVDRYLSMTGLDTSKPLDEQQYPLDVNKTWHDYFYGETISSLKEFTVLNEDAERAGFTLAQEDLDAIEENMQQLEINAMLTNYGSVKQYLAAQYGKGVTEDTVRRMMTLSMVATRYSEQIEDSYTYEESELEAWYQENKDQYDVLSYCLHYFSGAVSADIEEPTEEQTAEAMENAKKLADEMAAEVTDVESFDAFAAENAGATGSELTKSLGSSINGVYAEWLLDGARKEGDVKTFEDANGYYVVLFVAREDNHYKLRQVRHILASAEEDENGVFTDEAKAAAKADAEAYLKEWKAGEATEESFAALAQQYTDDTATAATGGLYETVIKNAYVEEFENFAFASGRKHGDTAIVYGESSAYAGYHVMYYVGEGQLYSSYIAENAKRSEDFNLWKDELVSKATLELGAGKKYIG